MNLRKWMCLYVVGKGIVVMFLVCGVLILGAFFHALENLTL